MPATLYDPLARNRNKARRSSSSSSSGSKGRGNIRSEQQRNTSGGPRGRSSAIANGFGNGISPMAKRRASDAQQQTQQEQHKQKRLQKQRQQQQMLEMQQYQPSSLRSKSDGDSCLFGIVDTLAAVDCFQDPLVRNDDVFSTSSSDAEFFATLSAPSSASPTASSSSSTTSSAFSATYPARSPSSATSTSPSSPSSRRKKMAKPRALRKTSTGRRSALKTLNRRSQLQMQAASRPTATWSGLKAARSSSPFLDPSSESPVPWTLDSLAAAGAPVKDTRTEADKSMDQLKQLLLEIEPPFGVLRPKLEPEANFEAAKVWVADSVRLLSVDLPAAADAVGLGPTVGLTFQALLKRASAESVAATGDGTMYADRDDRAAGAAVDLDLVPGGAAGASALAVRSSKLVELLRIKLEDDGDLGQASKTLRDCTQFFDKLKEKSVQDKETQYAVLEQLRDGL